MVVCLGIGMREAEPMWVSGFCDVGEWKVEPMCGDGEALCCRLGMGRFFIFCLQQWGNYMYSWVLGRRVNAGFSGMIVNEKFYYLSNENQIREGVFVGGAGEGGDECV